MIHVLVVDDEEAIRFMLRRPLEEAGYLVDEAQDGVEALSKIRKGSYDVMLLDVVMPNKGGIELLMDLRKAKPKIQVIVVTGRARVDTGPFKNLTTRLGVCEILEKPVKPEALLNAVKAALETAADPR
jgi:DNA-binding NtrC family response regulator